MVNSLPANVVVLSELYQGLRVFRDRAHAGAILADMLGEYHGGDALVLAIPAGGVPVGRVVADRLGLPLDVAVVSKITIPWDSEAGYGAVAFDGSVKLNTPLIARLGLSDAQVRSGIADTRRKVSRRVEQLQGDRSVAEVAHRPVILVDDGLASGFTMQAACDALIGLGADNLLVAVPTGHHNAVVHIAAKVTALYCPNIRRGWSFAVADAYERWTDVEWDEVMRLMA